MVRSLGSVEEVLYFVTRRFFHVIRFVKVVGAIGEIVTLIVRYQVHDLVVVSANRTNHAVVCEACKWPSAYRT